MALRAGVIQRITVSHVFFVSNPSFLLCLLLVLILCCLSFCIFFKLKVGIIHETCSFRSSGFSKFLQFLALSNLFFTQCFVILLWLKIYPVTWFCIIINLCNCIQLISSICRFAFRKNIFHACSSK